MTTVQGRTLLDTLAGRDDASPASALVQGMSVAFFMALTAASAQVSFPVPFTQVPFTLQPMIVLLGALVLGARLGALAQLAYLGLGAAGLPVFAAAPTLPPGLLRLLGPTGGYLMAYPLAAWVTGLLAERGFDRRYVTSVVAMAVGLGIVYLSGVAWLSAFLRGAGESVTTGLSAALAGGLYPFLLPDIVKLAVAASIVPSCWRLLGRQA